ncbi:cyclic nucleotide-binding domain-containing protein, partial [Cardiosporidium cionae]
MVAELMKKQPDDPIMFMKNWIKANAGSIEEKVNDRIAERPEGIVTTSESEVDEEEELDEFKEEMEFQKIVNKKDYKNMRTSVSAEVYGEFNKLGDFKAPVHAKSSDQKERILAKLNVSFLFSSLDKKEKDIIVNAMKIVDVKNGDVVIKQGDQGEELFVVDSGKLNCTKLFPNESEPKFLLKYGPGDAFGELALMYNAPRGATITAAENSRLLSLDRETFNHIVKQAVIKKREKFTEFLSKIQLLDSLNVQEKDKICDCLQIAFYRAGETVIKQGEKGDTFYFIQEGNCEATKWNKDTQNNETVFKFSPNDYFGELAILREEPRAATIIATTDLK